MLAGPGSLNPSLVPPRPPSPPDRAPEADGGEPLRGGTLKLIGTSDVDHLSPCSAYTLPAFTLLRIDATSVQQQLEAGTADLAWDVGPSTVQLAILNEARDPGLILAPPGDHWSVATYMPIYSSYQSDDVNGAIDRALAAGSQEDALAAWQEAATRVIEDAAIVPLTESKTPIYRSARVRHCAVNGLSMACDPTAVWLAR